MKILFQGSTYETSNRLTIDRMLNNGGTIIETKKEQESEEVEIRRPARSRRRKVEW